LATTSENANSAGALTVHHDDAAGCSYAGRQYLGDTNGDVIVPSEAVSELLAHGFVPVFEETIVASSRAKSAPSNRSKEG
jgi:hypothetical protein